MLAENSEGDKEFLLKYGLRWWRVEIRNYEGGPEIGSL